MNKTNYEELLQKRKAERQNKIASATVLHELVKHLSVDNIKDVLVISKSVLENADTAEIVSKNLDMGVDRMLELHEKISACLKFSQG